MILFFQIWKRWVDPKKNKDGLERLKLLVKVLLLRRTKDQKNDKGEPLVKLPDK
jgi:SNF2 family DNA or RNA helicase